MFNKAQSAVRWDGVVGDNITSKSGVLQGGIVSPNLFNHYLYDIGNYLEKKDGILVGSNPVNYLLYTHDLILMSTTASRLQNHINNLYKFCAAWHLIVSLPKTKVLIFNDSHKAEKYIFNFGKETIDIVSEYKYLGIIFTSNSRNVFDQTVIERQQKATAAMYQMCSDIKKLNLTAPYQTCSQDLQRTSIVSARIWHWNLGKPEANSTQRHRKVSP